MTFTNLDPDKKKQLIEFYKAMKTACKLFSNRKGAAQTAILHLADQIINELKKEQPDEGRVKSLADKLQLMANPNF